MKLGDLVRSTMIINTYSSVRGVRSGVPDGYFDRDVLGIVVDQGEEQAGPFWIKWFARGKMVWSNIDCLDVVR